MKKIKRSIRYYEQKMKRCLAENDVYGVYECFRKIKELEKALDNHTNL